ncbi:uncharacterized protein BXZ73DRAFT_57423 [Epithele typhae]|uniref:uncharacterized protein n=1 Tax=Epithele typhae TaxID=378194 RepID=UPI00200802BF|nr:uncharacterized protein BXZ73DRAFT_57423 [Epithele typhae]KAH9910974.1 hypothetical protein BXZ73DRAFT_57423 [Epithele typhae]
MHLVTSSIFLPTFIDLSGFYAATTATPVPPLPPAVPHAITLTPGDAASNLWLPLVQSTLVHPAEHLCKIARALLHGATVYGGRVPADFAALAGAGGRARRLALRPRRRLTQDRIGWVRERQTPGDWDRMGFFEHMRGGTKV